jgi:hypothetical protein
MNLHLFFVLIILSLMTGCTHLAPQKKSSRLSSIELGGQGFINYDDIKKDLTRGGYLQLKDGTSLGLLGPSRTRVEVTLKTEALKRALIEQQAESKGFKNRWSIEEKNKFIAEEMAKKAANQDHTCFQISVESRRSQDARMNHWFALVNQAEQTRTTPIHVFYNALPLGPPPPPPQVQPDGTVVSNINPQASYISMGQFCVTPAIEADKAFVVLIESRENQVLRTLDLHWLAPNP